MVRGRNGRSKYAEYASKRPGRPARLTARTPDLDRPAANSAQKVNCRLLDILGPDKLKFILPAGYKRAPGGQSDPCGSDRLKFISPVGYKRPPEAELAVNLPRPGFGGYV